MSRLFSISAPAIFAVIAATAGGALSEEPDPPTPSQLTSRQKLAAFAKKNRLTKPPSNADPAAGIHITNENIALLSGSGNLTEVTTSPVSSSPSEPMPQAHSSAAAGAPGGFQPALGTQETLDLKREYWRSRYQKGQQDLAEVESELSSLDEEIPRLWSVFYSTDDPAYRDQEIRPQLNAAISQREIAVTRIEEKRATLLRILGDARRDGALPGWFRDIK